MTFWWGWGWMVMGPGSKKGPPESRQALQNATHELFLRGAGIQESQPPLPRDPTRDPSSSPYLQQCWHRRERLGHEAVERLLREQDRVRGGVREARVERRELVRRREQLAAAALLED